MASEPSVPNATKFLRSAAIFHELSDDQLAEIWPRTKSHNLLRGECLVRQGAGSRSVYVVLSGRFEVWIEGQKSAITEIGVGEPIGEVGFFAGVPRTATIIAARDSVVIELDRTAFDDIVRKVPAIYQTLLRTLARRLAATNARTANEQRAAAARTVAIIAGGRQSIPQAFYDRLSKVVERGGKGRLLTESDLRRQFPDSRLDDPTVSNWLNIIELDYELIVYLADETLSDWTRKAVRQADQVLVVVSGSNSRSAQSYRGPRIRYSPPVATPACAGARAPFRFG